MKRSIRAIMAASLTWILLGVPDALLAARKEGAQLRITLTNNEVVKGELIGVRGDTIVMLTEQGDRTISLGETATLLIKGKSGKLIGGMIGLAAGVITDMSLYHSYKSDMERDEAGQIIGVLLMPGLIAVLILVPGAGTLGGMLIGNAVHKGKTYRIQGMTQEEIQGMMKNLRKKSMVPDYK